MKITMNKQWEETQIYSLILSLDFAEEKAVFWKSELIIICVH